MKDYESIAREIVYSKYVSVDGPSDVMTDIRSEYGNFPIKLDEELERIVFRIATALRETAEPLEKRAKLLEVTSSHNANIAIKCDALVRKLEDRVKEAKALEMELRQNWQEDLEEKGAEIADLTRQVEELKSTKCCECDVLRTELDLSDKLNEERLKDLELALQGRTVSCSQCNESAKRIEELESVLKHYAQYHLDGRHKRAEKVLSKSRHSKNPCYCKRLSEKDRPCLPCEQTISKYRPEGEK